MISKIKMINCKRIILKIIGYLIATAGAISAGILFLYPLGDQYLDLKIAALLMTFILFWIAAIVVVIVTYFIVMYFYKRVQDCYEAIEILKEEEESQI